MLCAIRTGCRKIVQIQKAGQPKKTKLPDNGDTPWKRIELPSQCHALSLTCMALSWPDTFQESWPNLDRYVYSSSPTAHHSRKSDVFQNAMLRAREKLGPLLNISQNSPSWQDNLEFFHWGDGWSSGLSEFITWVVSKRLWCECFSVFNLFLSSLFWIRKWCNNAHRLL